MPKESEEPETIVKFRIVDIIDPLQCIKERCPHAHIANVLFIDGSEKKMFYCDKFDCDNWIRSKKPLEDINTKNPPLCAADFFSQSPEDMDSNEH